MIARTSANSLLAVVLLVACRSEQPRGAPPPVVVEVAVSERVPVPRTTTYLSEIRARRSVVLHPRVSGYVREVRVSPGDEVGAGAVLVEIDARGEQAALETLQAAASTARAGIGEARAQRKTLLEQLAQARADAALAQAELERIRLLAQRGAASQEELDTARRNTDVATAATAAAKRRVDAQEAAIATTRRQAEQSSSLIGEQQIALDYFSIQAPFDGIVGDIPVSKGQLVDQQTAITTIDRHEGIDALIQVPADRGADLREGLPVEILDGRGNSLHETTITFVSPRVTEDSQTILVEATIASGVTAVRTGQLVRAKITWETPQQVIVPMLAVRRLNGKTFVFVVSEADEGGALVAHQRLVELGPLVDQNYPVLSGLEPGDRVAVGGAQKLRDGVAVELAVEPSA
ncbi:MAG: efflux RND transporter periplasmic adaptor subunit [Myxococcota bacterium]